MRGQLLSFDRYHTVYAVDTKPVITVCILKDLIRYIMYKADNEDLNNTLAYDKSTSTGMVEIKVDGLSDFCKLRMPHSA